jgi:predicted O-methyltransferase YrrM
MYSKIQIALNYLSYYLNASSGRGFGTHSPFVFAFITKVLNDRKQYEAYEKVEAMRKRLSNDRTLVTVEDLGAGSSGTNSSSRSVASIARTAAKPKKYGQLLYRIVRYYEPKTILDLGTSLGITTAYLALANPDAKLVTIEGAREIAEIAKRNFKILNLENTELIRGDFKYTLPMALKKMPVIDFAFIDGNHRRAATESYFRQVVEQVGNNSMLIFDDVHWSKEMEDAWGYIKQHPAVTCTIDLFFIGIVLFRKEFKEKQHFEIRF